MHDFFLGVTVTLCVTIGLFFLRFWRKAKDRLFLAFAVSFWLLGVNWLALLRANTDEPQTGLYVVRLVAFAVLLVGIWDKNRAKA